MKLFLAAPLLLCLSLQVFSQPSNDNCNTAFDLGMAPACPVGQTFTNLNATTSHIGSQNIPTCFQGGASVQRDVWFVFRTSPDIDISLQNYTITIKTKGSSGIRNPQIALYRGVCQTNGLSEWGCASAIPGTTEVKLEANGLIPGIPYYIRVNDFSSSGTPNWGDFEICVAGFTPEFNLGTAQQSNLCSGVLYDSGGPDGNYASRENLSFTICPNQPHQCLVLQVESYDTEASYDRLQVYLGANTLGPVLADLNGIGSNVEIQVPTGCVTIRFRSDENLTRPGFKITWNCSAQPCDNFALTTCDFPKMIPALPFELDAPSTCSSGNSVDGGPCGDDYLDGFEYVMAYDSPGDECIQIVLSNSQFGTGVGVFDSCPDEATTCLGFASSSFFRPNAIIHQVFLREPGRYYIVVGHPDRCTDFQISIITLECPPVLPSAALCENALPIVGCDITRPSIITVAQGAGDSDFLRDGVNEGCWEFILGANYVWFYVEAQADGTFGFLLKSANPDEFSDIDIQVWGPIADMDNACQYAATRQPLRSTFADINFNYDLTGLSDRNPILNINVRDNCEDALGDGFVKTIPVRQGEFYLVLVNDFSGVINSGAVSIDFSPTSPGVLDVPGELFTVSPDTVICPGGSVQLSAGGGLVYQWLPNPELSCRNCPDPIAIPAGTSEYAVVITGVCRKDTLSTLVRQPQLSLGDDFSVCAGESRRLVAFTNIENPTLTWAAPAGVTLSCIDCPNPVATFHQTVGSIPIIVEATLEHCTIRDTLLVDIQSGSAINFEVKEDFKACRGALVRIGDEAIPGYRYTWIDKQFNLISTLSDPEINIQTAMTLYVSVVSPDCPVPKIDSIHIEVADPPTVQLIRDTMVCAGQAVSINPQPTGNFIFRWSSSDGSMVDDVGSPIVTPEATTTYFVEVMGDTACPPAFDTVTIQIFEPATLSMFPDSSVVCPGQPVEIEAIANPGGTLIWDSGEQTPSITIAPTETILLGVTLISPEGCDTLHASAYVQVEGFFKIESIRTDKPLDEIYEGDELVLTVQTNPSSITGAEYVWFQNDQTLESFDSTQKVRVLEAGSYAYTVIVTSPEGCEERHTITIEVQPSIFQFPNVFTPDGDMLNDAFGMVAKGSAVTLLDLSVFNRWGKLIFQSTGLEKWDGTYRGEAQPSDVYIFVASIRHEKTGSVQIIKGDVTLLR